MAVSKPAGLLSQPTRAGGSDDLLSLVQAAYGKDLRLFHRLDRDTSGLCLLTRPGPVNAYLDAAFKRREMVKEYFALIASRGQLADNGQLRSYLDRHDRRLGGAEQRSAAVRQAGIFPAAPYGGGVSVCRNLGRGPQPGPRGGGTGAAGGLNRRDLSRLLRSGRFPPAPLSRR